MIFQTDCHLFSNFGLCFLFQSAMLACLLFFFFFKSGCPAVKLLKYVFRYTLKFCSNLFCQSNRVFMTDRDAANRGKR